LRNNAQSRGSKNSPDSSQVSARNERHRFAASVAANARRE
jgi:hypothetical protein